MWQPACQGQAEQLKQPQTRPGVPTLAVCALRLRQPREADQIQPFSSQDFTLLVVGKLRKPSWSLPVDFPPAPGLSFLPRLISLCHPHGPLGGTSAEPWGQHRANTVGSGANWKLWKMIWVFLSRRDPRKHSSLCCTRLGRVGLNSSLCAILKAEHSKMDGTYLEEDHIKALYGLAAAKDP